MKRRKSDAAFSLFSFQDIITSVMGIVILILIVLALELSQRQLASAAVQHALVRKDVGKGLQLAQERIQELQRQLKNRDLAESATMSASSAARERDDLERLLAQLQSDRERLQKRLETLNRELAKRQMELEQRQANSRIEQDEAELTDLKGELDKLQDGNILLLRLTVPSGKQAWLVELSGDRIAAAPYARISEIIDFPGADADSRLRQFRAWLQQRNSSRDYLFFVIKPGGTKAFLDLDSLIRREGFALGFDVASAEMTVLGNSLGGVEGEP